MEIAINLDNKEDGVTLLHWRTVYATVIIDPFSNALKQRADT